MESFYFIEGTLTYFDDKPSLFYTAEYDDYDKIESFEFNTSRLRFEDEDGEPLFYTKEEAQSYSRNREANGLQNNIANARASIAKYKETMDSYKSLKKQNLTDLNEIKRRLKVIYDNLYNL